MKKPSLEEVKEYFKDAEKVQCIFDKGLISEIDVNKIKFKYGEYWCEIIDSEINLWDATKGYAEILTYKEPKEETFVISREQIRRLYDMAYIQKMTLFKDEIKLLFPSAFVEDKKELGLEVGKWYNIQTEAMKYLLLYSDNKNELYAGFMNGNWGDDWCCSKDCNQKLAVLANPEEVKEALTKEATKRGFIGKNLYIKLENKHYQLQSEKGDFKLIGDIFFYQGAPILNKGVWAEIIPTITKEEAEQKLKCKII